MYIMNMQEFSTFMYNKDGSIKKSFDIDIYDILHNSCEDSEEYKIALEIHSNENLKKIYDDILSKYSISHTLQNGVNPNKTLFENLSYIHKNKRENILTAIDAAYHTVSEGKSNNNLWINRYIYKFFKWEKIENLNYKSDRYIDIIKIDNCSKCYIYKVNWDGDYTIIVSNDYFADFNKENRFNIRDLIYNRDENYIVPMLKRKLKGITLKIDERYNDCSYDYNPPFNEKSSYKLGTVNSADDTFLKPLHLVTFNPSFKCIYLTSGIEKVNKRCDGVEQTIAYTNYNSYLCYGSTAKRSHLKANMIYNLKDMYQHLQLLDNKNADAVISLMFPDIADEIMLKPIEKVKKI